MAEADDAVVALAAQALDALAGRGYEYGGERRAGFLPEHQHAVGSVLAGIGVRLVDDELRTGGLVPGVVLGLKLAAHQRDLFLGGVRLGARVLRGLFGDARLPDGDERRARAHCCRRDRRDEFAVHVSHPSAPEAAVGPHGRLQ
ncbi:hypothetical protein ACWGI8_12090 [Streptomyces sp. NPDC054841]